MENGVIIGEFFLRWLHYIFGIMWIGHLYYFNFSQTPFMAEADAATKSGVQQKLFPRTLFWFRWGAMFTFLTGWFLIFHKMFALQIPIESEWSVKILTGGIIGTLMFLNVWLIIWPNQKVVIENATQVAQGKPAIAGVADLAARAAIASRTNTLYSLPMLFFMGAASRLPLAINPEKSVSTYWVAFSILVGAIQWNAMKGKMGVMAKIGQTVHFGILLSFALYGLMWFLLR